MKECFVPKHFNGKSRKLLDAIQTIMADYQRDGFDLSVRQLFYQLVSKNIVPNRQKTYKSLVGLVNDARLAGVLDWQDIVDRGRNAYRPQHWASPAEMAREMAKEFKIDKWEDQPCYCEVMVEKQALEGVLLPVCTGLDVTFMANKGYSSASAFYRAGKRFEQRARQGKRLYIFYLGDHDPSGIDMTRDIEWRVPLLGGRPAIGGLPPRPLRMTVKRLALNMDQVRRFNPPENPAKETDSRAPGYVSRFGQSSWELDAVEPRTLASLVTQAVESIRDNDKWDEAVRREEKMRVELTKFAKTYDKRRKGRDENPNPRRRRRRRGPKSD